MKYSTVLFDADMTLFDFEKAEDQALKRTLEAHGYPSSEEVRAIYRRINEGLWRDFENQKITKQQLMEQRFQNFFLEIGIQDDGLLFNQEYLYALGDGAYLLPGALELCQKLWGHCQMYIVTNGVTNTQRRRFEASPLKKYIADIFVSEQTGYQKPRKEFFDYVFERVKQPDQRRTIIVGDSLSSDIRGGVNAGIDTCWFNPKGMVNTLELPCTYEAKTLEEIGEFLLKAK